MTPSCCGESGLSCAVAPGNEPDASDIRSDRAITEPPGDIERADTLDPAKDVISTGITRETQHITHSIFV